MCFGKSKSAAPTPQPAPVAAAPPNPNNAADTSNARQAAAQPMASTATMLTQPSGQGFGAELGTGSAPATGAA